MDALKDFGLTKYDIPPPFNINQNSQQDPESGLFYPKKTASKPGDYTEHKAEMDTLVVVTACPARPIPRKSGQKLKSAPIKVKVLQLAS